MTVYRHFTGVTYTIGAKEMAEEKSAYWLIDAIASHVVANPDFKKACKKDERFRDMQIWILMKTEKGADLIAVPDTEKRYLNNPAIKQEIEYTDFPFDGSGQYKLYCALNYIGDKPVYTILEPSEY